MASTKALEALIYVSARGLAWAMVAVFALGEITSKAIRLPDKVTAQFTLVPVRGAAGLLCACDLFPP